MLKSRVLVLGDANVDLVIPLEDRSPGDDLPRDSALELHGGGTAANVAVGLARLEDQVAFIGTVGDDGYGRWVMADFGDEGVNLEHTSIVRDVYTSMVLALIYPDGDRGIYVWPDQGGAHTKLHPDSIRSAIFNGTTWLHTTGLCLREEPVRTAQLKAMDLAQQAGLVVSLDLNLRLESWGMDRDLQKIFEQAIELSDIVFGNGVEEIIPYSGETSVQAGAEALSSGKRIVIARLGANGALVVAPGESFSSPAFQVEIVDSLGAGDAYNSGFISARLGGEELPEAARWGNAAAALKIGKTGARGLPTRQELLALLAE
ncbi:MAG: carbohydrate kinase family protein [Anaerolineales bacterium]